MNTKIATKIISIFIISAGFLVMINKILDTKILENLLPGFADMQFAATLSFIFSGIILYYIAAFSEKRETAQIALSLASLAIFAIMANLLISSLFQIQNGAEKLFFNEKISINTITGPDTPPATIINFILIAITGILTLIESSKLKQILIITGGTIIAISTSAILGYTFYLMAPHVFILFISLGVGLILSRL